MKLAAILLGLLAAAAAQFLALMLGGAGHGWTTPSLFSLFLWFAFPWTAARWARRRQGERCSITADAIVLGIGLLLDLLLVLATMAEGMEYYRKSILYGPLHTYGWIAAWLSWQVAITAWLLRFQMAGGEDGEGVG